MLSHQRVHRLDSLYASLVEQSGWRRIQGGERKLGHRSRHCLPQSGDKIHDSCERDPG